MINTSKRNNFLISHSFTLCSAARIFKYLLNKRFYCVCFNPLSTSTTKWRGEQMQCTANIYSASLFGSFNIKYYYIKY